MGRHRLTSMMPTMYGEITNLFVKPKHGLAMVEREAIAIASGSGIDGDINTNPISPRQILVARYEDLQSFSIQPSELRENIVVRGIDRQLFTSGTVLKTMGGAAMRLTFHCEPCKRIAHLVDSLKCIEGRRGMLAVAIADGVLKVGDRLYIEPNVFPPLSEIPYERFLDFVAKIPMGKVVTYRQIVSGIGVLDGHFRAIPNYLKKAAIAGYPVHRILDSKGFLTAHVEAQREKLEAEGVLVAEDLSLSGDKPYVSLESYLWEDPTIYLA